MDTIVNGCTVEQEALDEEYSDEVLCASWNPQLESARTNPGAWNDRHINLPADLVDVDVDSFLRKMYEYQC
jgi:hypothetical protein